MTIVTDRAFCEDKCKGVVAEAYRNGLKLGWY